MDKELQQKITILKCGIKQMKDFNAKLDKKYPMSKEEPKIEIKEERVEPVSISENAREICRIQSNFVDRLSRINQKPIYERDGQQDAQDKIDLVNLIKQMQKDIEELINKLNKKGEANDK